MPQIQTMINKFIYFAGIAQMPEGSEGGRVN